MTKFGQHFLTDKAVLKAMVKLVAEFGSHQTILEIGPGKGVLTKELVKIADRVIAVEIDTNLKPYLEPLTQQYSNLELIYGDILKLNLSQLGLKDGEYSLASNLPYEISGAVFRQFLTQSPFPSHLALLIQKEVAERITAKPGQLSILGLSVQAFSYPRIVRIVDRTAFSPKPAVQSAIISVERIRKQAKVPENQEKAFFRLIKGGFAQKRKLLRGNLQNINVNGEFIPKEAIVSSFQAIGLGENARAQELSVEQWVQLVDKLEKFIV